MEQAAKTMETAPAEETLKKPDLSKFGLPSASSFDRGELDRLCMESYNRSQGNLEGYDCPKCRNRGNTAYVKQGGGVGFYECDCRKIRRSILRMERSGLKNIIRDMTFETFRDTEPWQQNMKSGAKAYAENPQGWLLFCGQVGSGKSHLCTAVCRERLLKGDEVRYMPWREEIAQLKAVSRDSDKREQLMQELKTAPILYIDDLFKTGKSYDGSEAPSGADVNIAFEIINYRYVNQLRTIVSTEKTPQELLAIDEAVASRIIERARGHVFSIAREPARNYRMRGVIEV